MGEANGWESPGARGWGRSQTRKAVGAGSQADNLSVKSTPGRTRSRASCSSGAPAPRGPAGGPGAQPLGFLFLPAAVGAGRTPACRRPASNWAAGGCLARGSTRAAPLGAGSVVSDAGRGLAEAHSALLDAEESGLPRSPVLHSNPTSAEGPATTIVRPPHGEGLLVQTCAPNLTMARTPRHCHAASLALLRPELLGHGDRGGTLLPARLFRCC